MAAAAAVRHKERYIEALDAARDGHPAWAEALRRTERERFTRTDFPHAKQEAWRFTNVTPIIETAFSISPPRSTSPLERERVDAFSLRGDAHELVFLDGRFAPELSSIHGLPDGVVLMGLRDALPRCAELMEPHLGRHVAEPDAFTALNGAFLDDGAFLYVPFGVRIEKPIHLLFLTAGTTSPAVHFPRNLIVLEAHAEASLVETYAGAHPDGAYFNDLVGETVLGDSAHLHWYKCVDESPGAHHLASHAFVSGRGSCVECCTVTLGGAIVRNAQTIAFRDEGAECQLNGLYLNDGSRLTDTALFVDHAAPHCTSRIAYRGVLDGNSKSVFSGRVLVRKDAQRTDSNQLNNNILLSDRAAIDAKPQLQIYADDVKCTHGATVGQPPEDLVFYLRTRGLDRRAARSLLLRGFTGEILEQIRVEPLRRRLDTAIAAHYSRLE